MSANCWIWHKNECPPKKSDADAQGCVLVYDELACAWTARHYLNLSGSHINWWMKMPPKPEELRRA